MDRLTCIFNATLDHVLQLTEVAHRNILLSNLGFQLLQHALVGFVEHDLIEAAQHLAHLVETGPVRFDVGFYFVNKRYHTFEHGIHLVFGRECLHFSLHLLGLDSGSVVGEFPLQFFLTVQTDLVCFIKF